MIGSIRNTLVLNNPPVDIDVFGTLDAGDSRLKTLHLIACKSKAVFQYLAQSTQSEYIKRLFITNTEIDSILPLESMSALTKLSTCCLKKYTRPIHLVDCLSGCPPTLKALTIRDEAVLPASFTKELTSVKFLNLGVSDITCNIGDIISECFPNLAVFTLRGKVKGDVHIALKNSHFQTADIQIHGDRRDKHLRYGFSFKPANTTETRYHMCSYKNTSQVDFEDIKNLPLLSVECFTERKTESTQREPRSLLVMSDCSKKGLCKLKLY
jgi:hypothetical protein